MEEPNVICVDLRQHDVPCRVAEALSRINSSRAVEIIVEDIDLCPNRIVPVVGIADAIMMKGADVRFRTLPHGAGEKALSGFNARQLNPMPGPENRYEVIGPAFGRVWRFDNGGEQGALVNAMVLELDRTANLAKGVKQCFEWCLNEVTDNVLNHSAPAGGAHGYVMVQFVQSENRLKVCVFDAGIGLKRSFLGSQHNPKDAADAIRMAIGKGITSGRGQGNGLWGLHEMVKIGKHGKLHIRSDGAEYLFNPSESIDSYRPSWALIGFPGTTTVDFQMVCSEATRLQDIFGEDYASVDLWQEDREQADGSLLLKVKELASGYGSRESAREVRHIVENAIDNDRKFVVLDFDGIETCSSSFIDELLVKLVAKYGIVTFAKFLKVSHLRGLPAGLANFSAAQRLDLDLGQASDGIGASGPTGQYEGEASGDIMVQMAASTVLSSEKSGTVLKE